MGFFHASEQTANKDFVQYFRTVFDISPYFKNQYNNPPIRLISSGPKSVGRFSAEYKSQELLESN